MKSKTISRLPGVASEGHRTAFILLVVPNPVPKPESHIGFCHEMKHRRPVRLKLTLDGAAPGDNNGVDTGADGNGEIREPRMYQLIRLKGFPIGDRTFEIEFLDPGAQVLDFTFG